MGLNKNEIESVSKLEPFKRYKYFIKKVADYEELWTVVNKNKDWVVSEIDNKSLLSFWTAEEFVESNLDREWKGFMPLKITLDKFEKVFVPLIHEKDYLINIFPVNGKSGFVVNINEFVRDLNDELENYS